MRIAVVGGKLQGVEACYLARKAGWQVRLVDRCPDVLARGMCDEFIGVDLCREGLEYLITEENFFGLIK